MCSMMVATGSSASAMPSSMNGLRPQLSDRLRGKWWVPHAGEWVPHAGGEGAHGWARGCAAVHGAACTTVWAHGGWQGSVPLWPSPPKTAHAGLARAAGPCHCRTCQCWGRTGSRGWRWRRRRSMTARSRPGRAATGVGVRAWRGQRAAQRALGVWVTRERRATLGCCAARTPHTLHTAQATHLRVRVRAVRRRILWRVLLAVDLRVGARGQQQRHRVCVHACSRPVPGVGAGTRCDRSCGLLCV